MVRESVACQSCQAEMKLPYPKRACERSNIGIGLMKKMSDLQSSGGPCICAFGFYEAVRKKTSEEERLSVETDFKNVLCHVRRKCSERVSERLCM